MYLKKKNYLQNIYLSFTISRQFVTYLTFQRNFEIYIILFSYIISMLAYKTEFKIYIGVKYPFKEVLLIAKIVYICYYKRMSLNHINVIIFKDITIITQFIIFYHLH